MLRQLDQDLWVIDHPLKLAGAEFGTRTTIIRLRDGSLFMHSPGPTSAALRQALRTLGEVRHIVAPNKMHWFYVAENARAYPDAQVWLAPELAHKKPELKGLDLSDAAPDAWSTDLDQLWVRGAPMLQEIVFVHPATRTLLLTDLSFNFHEAPDTWSRVLRTVTGSHNRFGPSRIARNAMKDKKQVRADIERVLQWDFDRVIVAHGDVLETGGHEALERGYAKIGA